MKVRGKLTVTMSKKLEINLKSFLSLAQDWGQACDSAILYQFRFETTAQIANCTPDPNR